MTEDEVRRIMLNPFYAIEIAPMLAEPHDPMVTEEQWIVANTKLIEEMGTEAWLRELLAVLKGDQLLSYVPVVMLSTSAAPEDVAGAYREHANAYVAKPVNLDDFIQAVQSIDAFFFDTVTRPG